MKKNVLAICFAVATVVAVAQSPRLSLFEEFTGETCPPCAAVNPGLDAILASPTNTPKVVAIKWQVPIPSAPTPTWSLYKSNQTEISQRASYYPSQQTPTSSVVNYVNSAPQGRFDGQYQWVFGATNNHPFYVNNNLISTAQSYTSAFSIVLVKQMDQANSAFNVTVNILATAPFTATGSLVFRTVMVDKLVQFSVQPGTNGEKTFHDVAVKSFPSLQSGVALNSSWTVGQSKTFTLNCPIPAYLLSGQHNRSTANLDFVGFIQDNGNKKVAQAARSSDCVFITASVANTLVCAGEPVTLFASGNNDITWNTGQTGGSIVVTPTADVTYYATSNDPGACPNRAEVALTVQACTGLLQTTGTFNRVNIYPNPSTGEFVVRSNFTGGSYTLVVYNQLGQKVLHQALQATETAVHADLPKGIYTYEVQDALEKVDAGKLVIE